MSSPARVRALTALLLLMPATPMLFQGQEFASSAPFLYFAHHEPELAAAVKRGRAEFLTQFPSARGFEQVAELADPADPRTFLVCKLDFGERATHAQAYALHRDLLRLRRDTPAFRAQRHGGVDGSVVTDRVFALRYLTGRTDDRLLLVNLGGDHTRASIADPLFAPPRGCDWEVEWSSDDPRYDGPGASDLWPEGNWAIPGESAYVLRPVPARPRTRVGLKRRTA